MQHKYLFEYAVIRVVPQVEREEFMNVGVIVYCSKLKLLQARYLLDEARLQSFSAVLNIAELREHICSMERICLGGQAAGPIGQLDMASRFRWLTATRSTVVQTSKVHPGFCVDALETLEKLFNQLVA